MKKKTGFLLITLLPLLSFSQLNTGAYAGWDTHGRAIAAWSVGTTIKQFIEVQGEVRPSLTRSVFMNNYIGGRLGLHLINPDEDDLSVILGGGYFYNLRSSDKTSMNKYYWATFIKSVIMITENGGLGVDLLYLNNSLQASVGIHFLFTKRDRPYPIHYGNPARNTINL